MKKTPLSSIEAADHMKDYRDKIETKNKELEGLEGVKSDTRKELLDYVSMIKSSDEHKISAVKYHKDVKKARELLSILMKSDLNVD